MRLKHIFSRITAGEAAEIALEQAKMALQTAEQESEYWQAMRDMLVRRVDRLERLLRDQEAGIPFTVGEQQ